MPDGPVVALAVLVAGLAILGIGFVIARVRNPDRGRHHAARTAPRLPLFGTDLLLVRTVDDDLVAPEATDAGDVAARPADRTAAASFAPPSAPPSSPRSAPADGTAPLTVTADGTARPRPTPPRPAPARDTRAPMRPAAERPGAPRSPIEFRTTSTDAPSRPADVAAALAAASHTASASGAASAPMRSERSVAAPAARAELRSTGGSAGPAVLPEPEEYVEGQTLRFAIPTDGTLQFLPGRLEVIDGADTGREIRFVRLPGEPAVEVTFGRTAGPPYSHVQLHARTVSRRHAVMSLLDGHWQLQNLSTTNPVVLNGRSLAPDEIAPLLVEGDRIEMGEIVFVFHAR